LVEPLKPGKIYELDVEIWPTCIVVPAGYQIGLSIQGKDYEYAGEGARLSTFVKEMKGCGPFVHDDPQDRSPEIYGGKVTLYGGGDKAAYVLLPIIPKRNTTQI
jgi:predicted acyl esterase